MINKIDFMNLGKTDPVRCMVCQKRHFSDEETFLTFWGDVTIGLNGGIIGHNFDEYGQLSNLSFLCRDISCIKKILEQG